jgi:hypothetical protein
MILTPSAFLVLNRPFRCHEDAISRAVARLEGESICRLMFSFEESDLGTTGAGDWRLKRADPSTFGVLALERVLPEANLRSKWPNFFWHPTFGC